jgi:hypothetical protein
MFRPTGGATASKPDTWDNNDLAVYFDRSPSFTSVRAATRTISTGTLKPTSTGSPSKTNVKAIAGGVVGGLAALIALLSLILFCLHRKKKARKNAGEKGAAPTPPPVELAATSPIHEMSSPGATKYMSMTAHPDMRGHPAYSSVHSRSLSDEHRTLNTPYPPQAYSPTNQTVYPSQHHQYAHQPQHPNHQPYTDQPSPSYDSHSNVYDEPSAYPTPSSPNHHRQYSYPTPTSPDDSSFQPSPTQQHEHQVYYPPPPDHAVGIPSNMQYNGDTKHMPPSTTNTPAQFYTQSGPMQSTHAQQSTEGLRPYQREGDEHSSTRSVDSRSRPNRGRFVEVGMSDT